MGDGRLLFLIYYTLTKSDTISWKILYIKEPDT